MAEPEHDATAPAPPRWLHDAEQVAQKYEEAVAVAVEAYARDALRAREMGGAREPVSTAN